MHREGVLFRTVHYSRRTTPRIEADDQVYIFWYCNGLGNLSRVRNLNLGGIFIETCAGKDLGIPVKIHFLVREGEIRAEAVVSHAVPGQGLGLKFTALQDQDRLHFGALMKRLYSTSLVHGAYTASAPN
jgi:hypothetical protein